MRASLLSLLLLCACHSAPNAATPTPDEVAVRKIVDDVCDLVSGAKDERRPLDRLLALFVDGASMHVSMKQNGKTVTSTFTPKKFVEMIGADTALRSFYERALVTRIETFAGVAHAWSSYEAREAMDGEPIARGINAFTFVKTKDGWRIASIAWSEESEGEKLPDTMR